MKTNPRLGVARLLTLWSGLLVALCSLPALAITVTDTFTNAANWEAFLFAGPEYNFAVTNGRLNYTATVTNEGGAAVRRIAKDLPGNTNVLYLTQDWSLKVDVHIDPLTVTAYDQFTDVFLGFAKTGDEFNTHVIFEFDRGGWEYFNDYDIGDDVQINGSAAPGLFNVSGLTSPDAALQFDYNAANHTITYLFDANGATGGYNWASMGTTNLASGTYDLQLGASDTLTIILVGSSALTVVSNGQAYLDNLEITVTTGTPGSDFLYMTNNGAITITGYVGPGGAVTIPDTINGRPVTQIAGDAFTHKYSLTGISCPNTATNIGSHAFYSCTNLASLSLGAGVCNIEINAFAFCSSLSAVNFPASLTNIGYGAFQYCRSITSVALAYGIISLGDYAFNNCSSLTEVNLPASVTSLGVGVFAGCSSLNAIGADSANPSYAGSNGVLFTKSLKRLVQYPGGRAGAYAIPASVTGIGSLAFANCWRLTGTTFPSGVTNVGASAFALCSGLTNLVIPSTIRSLEDQAFGYCNALKSVFFAGIPPSLGGSSVFINDNNTTVYYLPGTTGWGATYGGRPAVLWNPTPLTSAANFGVQTNRFGFTLTGTANIPFVVEASTNLVGGSWTALLRGTLTNGAIYFSDPQWTNHRNRYYRIRSP